MATPEEIRIRIIARDETRKAMESVRKEMDKTSAMAGKLKAAFIAIAGSAVLRQWYETNKTFQSLRMTLNTVSNSSEEAAKSWELINRVGVKIPSSIEELTRSFVKMKALGIEPTEETILSFSNTASAMGKSFEQFSEAVADAITGEFERLKEFGIKASSEGDKVSFTFRGMTTTIEKDSASILKYLQRIGNVEFAGAAQNQMDTVAGAVSNLGVAFDNLFVSLEENETITYLINKAEMFVNSMAKTIKASQLEATLPVDITTPGTFGDFAPVGGPVQITPPSQVKSPEEIAEENKKLNEQLKEITRTRVLDEEYSIKNSYVLQLQALKELNAAKMIEDEKYAMAKQRIEQRMTQNSIAELATGFQALGQYNKKAFAIGKAAGIANAIINTYQGATKALATYPPPFSYAMAAGQIAMGMAQVAQIKSASFSGRAVGGSVTAGVPYMVGEQGQEMFIPSTNGQIVPNSQLGNSEANQVNVSFTINAVDTAGFDQLLNSRRGQIVGMINRAMNERGRVGVV